VLRSAAQGSEQGLKQESDQEDVVQEALARASMRWTRLRAYDAPEAWVRRVALHLAADRARRGRRRLAALRRLGPPAPTPPVQVEDLALLEALRGLSIGQRPVLVLHYLVGMPVQEVARTLGVPSGTVKVRLARGRHPQPPDPWSGGGRKASVIL
jgi:RNA polymerase sigma-70 factor (ECF subfamily)